MPARHDFNASRFREQIIAALRIGTLEIMAQAQKEMQIMLSQPGRGKIYAKTKAGIRRLDDLMGVGVGTNKGNALMIAATRLAHAESGKRGRADLSGVLGAYGAAQYGRNRAFVATRVGMTLNDRQIASLLRKPNGGTFRNLGAAGLHQASAPGDPPAVRTGTLRRSISMSRPQRRSTGTTLGWRITIGVKYAPWLEFGTRRIRPRPFLKPAMDKVRPLALRILRNRLRLAGFRGL
jgi:HK97 gp10 family phage protein